LIRLSMNSCPSCIRPLSSSTHSVMHEMSILVAQMLVRWPGIPHS
jgi:hypothetical protein